MPAKLARTARVTEGETCTVVCDAELTAVLGELIHQMYQRRCFYWSISFLSVGLGEPPPLTFWFCHFVFLRCEVNIVPHSTQLGIQLPCHRHLRFIRYSLELVIKTKDVFFELINSLFSTSINNDIWCHLNNLSPFTTFALWSVFSKSNKYCDAQFFWENQPVGLLGSA